MSTTLRTTLFSTLAILGSATITSCGDDAAAKEVRNDMQQTLDSVSTWSQKQWDEFTNSTSDRWEQLQKSSTELKAKAKEQGQEISKEIDEAMDAAGNAVQDLKAAGKSQWENLSTKANESLDTANKRLEAAWEALKGGKSGS